MDIMKTRRAAFTTIAILAAPWPLTVAHGQALPWKIEMRQVREPIAGGDCGPIELVVRDATGKTPMTPDGKQIDWQDFDIALTQGAGPLSLSPNGRFLCATAPGATGVVTAKYPESTYLTGNGKGRTGKKLIPGATAEASLNVRSAGQASAQKPGSSGMPPTPALPKVTGITVTAATGGPIVAWDPIVGASYTVMRWKVDDPGCCNNMSPPSRPLTESRWQDTALPTAGTYVYRVTATTSAGAAYAESQYSHAAATTTSGMSSTFAATAGRLGGAVPTDGGVSGGTGVVSSTVQNTLQTTSCEVPVETITGIKELRVNVSGAGEARLAWWPVRCPSIDYTLVRVITRDGQIQQSQAKVNAPIDPVTIMATVVDSVSVAGASSANYRVDTVLPDGRTVSSAWVSWSAPSATAASTAGTPASGRYRVVVKGIRVDHHTQDHILQVDGKYDEVYIGIQAALFDRKTGMQIQHGVGRSRVHGDVGGNAFPDRVRAGSASPQGGLVGNDLAMPPVNDVVPYGFSPGGPPAVGLSDRIPFVAWEGTLRAGTDLLIIAPSIWEYDGDDTPFKQYADISKGTSQLLWELWGLAKIADTPDILVAQAPVPMAAMGTISAKGLTTEMFLLSGLSGGFYELSEKILGAGADRPIGVTAAASVGTTLTGMVYQDWYVVLTQEKIERALTSTQFVASSLPPSVVMIQFVDGAGYDLGGKYTMYIEVQRL